MNLPGMHLGMGVSGRVDHDRAVELAQQFLGDLGIVASADLGHAMATDHTFIIRFSTAADALEANNVVVVNRESGDCRFATLRPDDTAPGPAVKPIDPD